MKNSVGALPALLAMLCWPAAAGVDPAPVVRVEYAFAAAAAARGVRDAFLEYAARDAVLFRPRAVPAHEFLEASPPSTSRLEWYPEFAVLAASHDFGFTTGPWSARREADGPVAAAGHYVTVWKLQRDGAWRFLVDHGISHEVPATPPVALSAGTESGNDVLLTAFSDRAAALAALDAVNDALDVALAEQGPGALLELCEDGVRVYREGEIPRTGIADARPVVESAPRARAARRVGSDVSEAGDLGFTYGYTNTDQDGNRVSEFVYLRIWRRNAGEWNVLLDLETPLPPAGSR